jgi:integrase
VKPQQVNQEMTLLMALLKKAWSWRDESQREYEPLREEIEEMPRALTPAEQQRWLDTARSRPRWNLLFWWSLLAFDTCMSTNELRRLRLGDINLPQRMIRVPVAASKNAYRHRDIEIAGAGALWALDQLVRRAHSLGAFLPLHYLFPFKITQCKQSFPDRPMTSSGLKKLWQEVRVASDLTWFRMYDTRHTAITRLAEGRVRMADIIKRAGHSNLKMAEHYTHLCEGDHIMSVRRGLQKFNSSMGAPFRYEQPPYAEPVAQYARSVPPASPATVDPAALSIPLAGLRIFLLSLVAP